MLVVFTDLDGTLLDSQTYSFGPAVPAQDRLSKLGARVVLLSSKTQKEVQVWRKALNNNDPFAVENGGAVLAARGNPPLPGNVKETPDGYAVVEFGVPYGDLVRGLSESARESSCLVRGFADMTPMEISRCCEMDIVHAEMAKTRYYDEPFELLQGDPTALRAAIEKRGFSLTQGGRFFHITGGNDKADAVSLLVDAYRCLGKVRTIGIGDGLNDVGFLNIVDHPVILESPLVAEVVKRVPRARVFPEGPSGWNDALMDFLNSGPS